MFRFLRRLFVRKPVDRQKDFLNRMAPGAIVTDSTFEDNVVFGSGELFTVPNGRDLRGVAFKNNRVVAAEDPYLAEEVRARLNGGDGY